MALPQEKHYPHSLKVETVKTLCYRCSKPARNVTIQAGSKAPPVLCANCLAIPETGFVKEEVVSNGERKLATKKRLKKYPLDVTVYFPGDPGFDEIAATITPIWEIHDYYQPHESWEIGF